MSQPPVNILCLKWGTRYGPHYVNFLHRAVRRHLRREFRFYCCTERPEGLDPEVRVIPFPPDPGMPKPKVWPDVMVKLLVTEDGFGGLSGPTLFLDLDVAIMGELDVFFDYLPGKNCIIHNWVGWHKTLFRPRPHIGNSSVFRFEAGRSGYIAETFRAEIERAVDRRHFATEQAFLTYAMREAHWWPEEWCRSYKRHCRPLFPLNHFVAPRPPPGCRVLVFHGRPDPDEAIAGFRGHKPHHRMLPAPWINEHWRS